MSGDPVPTFPPRQKIPRRELESARPPLNLPSVPHLDGRNGRSSTVHGRVLRLCRARVITNLELRPVVASSYR